MTKLNLMIAFAAAVVTLSSCSSSVSEDVEPTNSSQEKATKTITLSLNEENITMSVEPMSRALSEGGKRYYAINIWEKSNKNYMKYAYGLFDGTSTIAAMMTEGKTYRIEVMEFRNDKDTLYHEGPTFYEPMMAGGKTPTQLTNTFTYDKKVNLSAITTGKTKLGAEESDTTWYPRAGKYYAKVDNFDPANADNLSITVRRAFFGLHFKVEPPKYGTVKLIFLRNHSIELSSTDPAYEDETIYSFNQVDNASDEKYKADIELRAIWTANGEIIQDEKTMFPIKRNAITNLNINFAGPKDISQTIGEEDTPMDTLEYNWTFKVK